MIKHMVRPGYMVYPIIMSPMNSRDFMPNFQHAVVFSDKVKADEFKHEKLMQSPNPGVIWMMAEVGINVEVKRD